jgi:ferric-dicitrate binding protein FerR (iron transport regulator)
MPERYWRSDVTKAGRAWRKANTYVRSGQHAKAIKWLSRTVEILDSEPPRRRRFDGVEASYILGALVVLVALWVAAAQA